MFKKTLTYINYLFTRVLQICGIENHVHIIWTNKGLEIVGDWELIEFYNSYFFHRANKPAIVWSNGTKEWYFNNKKHRLDGPAIEFANGIVMWYINGKELPHSEVEEWIEGNNINLQTKEGQLAFKLRWS